MKLLKRSLVLLGCALAAAAAFTACELELGNNDDRQETNQETEDGSGITLPEAFTLTNSELSGTFAGLQGAFDCFANQSSVTWDTNAKLSWANPLSGKTNLEGVTISFMLNNKIGASFDSILTFFPSTGFDSTTWGGVAFTENGTAHAQGHGYWDIYLTSDKTSDGLNTIPAETWTRVTYVITEANVTAYIGNEEFSKITLTDVDTVTYLTSTCDKVAVGVGFCPALWAAGYVDESTYLADIKIWPSALTAAQVAAIK